MTWFSMEMVPSALHHNNGETPMAEQIKQQIESSVPRVKCWIWLLHLPEYDCPQDRTRMWLCGADQKLCRYDEHGVFGKGWKEPSFPLSTELGYEGVPPMLSTLLGNFPKKLPKSPLQQGVLVAVHF